MHRNSPQKWSADKWHVQDMRRKSQTGSTRCLNVINYPGGGWTQMEACLRWTLTSPFLSAEVWLLPRACVSSPSRRPIIYIPPHSDTGSKKISTRPRVMLPHISPPAALFSTYWAFCYKGRGRTISNQNLQTLSPLSDSPSIHFKQTFFFLTSKRCLAEKLSKLGLKESESRCRASGLLKVCRQKLEQKCEEANFSVSSPNTLCDHSVVLMIVVVRHTFCEEAVMCWRTGWGQHVDHRPEWKGHFHMDPISMK